MVNRSSSTAGVLLDPAPREEGARSLLGRLATVAGILLVSLAVFLALSEVVLRVYLARHIFYDVEMSRYATLLKIPSPNPEIGHVHRPNSAARLMGVDVRINSDGLRDDEYSLARNDRRRIVFLGDSLTLGWGVEKHDTFEALLEKQLSRTEPTEILNFGTGNYNTTQEVGLFLEKGLRYQPDEVVLFFFINDAEPVPRRSAFWWLAYSRVATFYWSRTKQLAARFTSSSGFREYYSQLYRDDQPGWQAAKRAFLTLRETCNAQHIALRVVLLPELHELVQYPFAREHGLVLAFLHQNGIAALDLAPTFANETDPQRLWVARDDAHPNALAHRLIAERSLAFVAQGLER